MMDQADHFKTRFKELTGHEPMAWQSRLFFDYFLKGELPNALDIPTGLGKTAVIAIWLIALGNQFRTDEIQPRLPRRLVYVVDRRAVVDQATEEALRIRKIIDEDHDLKKSLGLRDGQPLLISTLRGQFVDNREWLDDPSTPAIIVGTVDMVGSRLLFEGYGVSRKMRPYYAGLLGVDALIVLDEAHLVPPFEHLLRSIETEPSFRPHSGMSEKSVPPFRLLALSATGRTYGSNVLGLTEEDLQHALVAKRLNARKRLQITPNDEETKLEDALAKHAWALADDGKKAVRVLVYSDSRDIAQKAKAAVERLAKGDKKQGTPKVEIETELFVGARRVFEREDARQWLQNHGFIAGSAVERSRPVFLFATSAGEVGVDLDADHMVCDLVAWERMVQRLGRANRRGDGKASIVVVVEPKPKPNKMEQEVLDRRERNENLEEKERKRAEAYERKVRDWESRLKPIEHLRSDGDGSYDASPGALQDLKMRAVTNADLRKILNDATTPEPLRPALTRPIIEAWAMTSLEKHTGRPAIQPWLRGWVEDDEPQTAVVWRIHLPVRRSGPVPSNREIEAFFEAAPTHTSEILETETFRVVKWLAARANSIRKQQRAQDGAADKPGVREDHVVAFAFDRDGRLRRAFTLAEIDPSEDGYDKERLDTLLKDATLVVDARLGGLKDGLLDDEESGYPRVADDGQDWIHEGAVGFRVRSSEASGVLPHERNWRERLRFATAMTEDGEANRWLIVEKWRQDAATEEDRSTASRPQLLEEHQSWTEERARALAQALKLEEPLVKALALAARFHDEGKRAARWQRAFHAPQDGVYAKTEGPIDYRLLDGYRHELGSLLRVEHDERIRQLPDGQRDLVFHLIAAHHGFARPLIGTNGCEDLPPSALKQKASEIALRFARLQDRWGPWRLAWLEALLRAADQQASRDNDARTAGGEGP